MQVNQAAEPLYIVKPFKGKGIAGLFSTHPPIEERVQRLRQMRPQPRRPSFPRPSPEAGGAAQRGPPRCASVAASRTRAADGLAILFEVKADPDLGDLRNGH